MTTAPKRMTHHQRRQRRLAMALSVGAGNRSEDVASRYGVTPHLVRVACREFGVKPVKPAPRKRRHRTNRTKFRNRMKHSVAAIWYRRGYSLQKIGEHYGLSRERIRQMVNEVDAARPKGARLGHTLTRMRKCDNDGCGTYHQRRLARYCSRECRRANCVGGPFSDLESVTHTCAYCGHKFERTRHLESISAQVYRNKNSTRHNYFCCQEHYHAYRRKHGSPHSHLYTLNGESLPVSAWARRLGVLPQTIRERLKNGWPIERALTAPPKGKARQ